MNNEQMISVEQFCAHYHVQVSFIEALTEFGLAEITTIETTPYILNDHISQLEKLIHLHYDLDINMEGIDAISHLLNRVSSLQSELSALRNRLRFYEDQ
jgi:hypothetical protein